MASQEINVHVTRYPTKGSIHGRGDTVLCLYLWDAGLNPTKNNLFQKWIQPSLTCKKCVYGLRSVSVSFHVSTHGFFSSYLYRWDLIVISAKQTSNTN